MSDVVISVNELAKRYRLGEYHASYGTLRDSLVNAIKRAGKHEKHVHEEIWALDGVSFELRRGEVLGLIGGNGAGKSTLLKILTRIAAPTRGSVTIRGRVGSLLEVGTGFHPELTGRENVYLNGAILGMRRREISARFDEIVEFSGVEQFIDTPVKRYSSGMYVRLAFSVAAHLEPEVLLVDEVLAVGDAEFQRRCLGRMEALGESGRTVIFVSHNMQTVAQLCDRAVLLERGKVRLDGESGEVVAHYLQSGLGSGSDRAWADDQSAPGDQTVRLLGARVVGEDGDPLDAVDVRRPVGIEITFRVLRDGPPLRPKFKLVDRRGDIAFNAWDIDGRVGRSERARTVRRDSLDPRQPVERRALQRGHRRLLDRRAEAPSPLPGALRRRLPRPGPRPWRLGTRDVCGSVARRHAPVAPVDRRRASRSRLSPARSPALPSCSVASARACGSPQLSAKRWLSSNAERSASGGSA